MIVRIMGEGQYRLADETLERLNALDARLEAALDAGERGGFAAILAEMVALVRAEGEPLPDDSLEPSDAVLPAEDTTAEELRAMLTEEGLIPGT